VISSILSGSILDLDGFSGIAGWRWLFLLLGLPSVVLGIAAIFYLTDLLQCGRQYCNWTCATHVAKLFPRQLASNCGQ
jgi:MFS family permease